jgi:hypothetical protein
MGWTVVWVGPALWSLEFGRAAPSVAASKQQTVFSGVLTTAVEHILRGRIVDLSARKEASFPY